MPLPTEDPLAAFFGPAVSEPIAPRTITGEQIAEDADAPVGTHGDDKHSVIYAKAAALQSHADAGHLATTRRSSDAAPINNSTTLVPDDTLVIPVLANRIYAFEILLIFDSAANADLKIGWTVPEDATMLWQSVGAGPADALVETDILNVAGSGVGTAVMIAVRGIIRTAGFAGNVVLTRAQQTAQASDTTVQKDSHVVKMEL